MFAHCSGSRRQSPRNRWVAGVLQRAHMATHLFDLLTEKQSCVREPVVDIDLLAKRGGEAIHWTLHHPDLTGLHLGLFGASTGAAAALVASAVEPY